MNKLQLYSLVAATSLVLPSCMTTYDRNARPFQSVGRGLAAVGIVGAGLLGAAIASNNNDHRSYRSSHRDYHYQPAPCRTGRGHGGHGRH